MRIVVTMSRLLSVILIALMLGSAEPASAQSTSSAVRLTLDDSVAAMGSAQRSLRDLLTRMEAYFADHGTYTTSLGSLQRGASEPGVTLRVLRATRSGWSAMATHSRAPGLSCVVTVGDQKLVGPVPTTSAEKLMPTDDGSPVCDRPTQIGVASASGGTQTTIVDKPDVRVAAGHLVDYKIIVPATNGTCKIVGRARGLSGGNHDFNTYLFTDDQYISFLKGEPQPGVPAPAQADAPLDYQLYGGGTYYLVFSNRFSSVTDKLLAVKATLVCSL
jgi:hypothetical protein